MGQIIEWFNAFQLMRYKQYPVSGNSMKLISIRSNNRKDIVDKKIIVNNDIAAKDTPVYPNFNVKYQDMSEMSYDELEADDSVKETDVLLKSTSVFNSNY